MHECSNKSVRERGLVLSWKSFPSRSLSRCCRRLVLIFSSSSLRCLPVSSREGTGIHLHVARRPRVSRKTVNTTHSRHKLIHISSRKADAGSTHRFPSSCHSQLRLHVLEKERLTHSARGFDLSSPVHASTLAQLV